MSNQQPPTFDEIYRRFHGAKVIQENCFEQLFADAVTSSKQVKDLTAQLSQMIQEKRAFNKPEEKKDEKPKTKIIEKAKNA